MGKSIIKALGIAAAVAVVAIVLLNADYVGKNVEFSFAEDKTATTTASTLGKNRISIPSLGINAPIVEPEDTNEAVFQTALMRGVAHFPGTGKPGRPGNAFLFGHSSDFPWKAGDYKTVFALLPRIEIGSEIIVSDESGNEFTYEVMESFVAEADAVYLLQPPEDPKEYRLTLQTSYPLGTAWKRWIVVARIKN